jgi:hypothetical protein
MKSSLPTGQAGHDEHVTHWDDYRCEIPPRKDGASSRGSGQVMTAEKKI